MKTAMQQLIEWLENSSDVQNDILNWEIVKKNAFEKEKEQIIDAYEAAIERPIENYAEAYYNMNYNQDIKYTFENIDLGKGNNNNNLISTSNKKTEWVKNVQNNLTIYQSKLNKNNESITI